MAEMWQSLKSHTRRWSQPNASLPPPILQSPRGHIPEQIKLNLNNTTMTLSPSMPDWDHKSNVIEEQKLQIHELTQKLLKMENEKQVLELKVHVLTDYCTVAKLDWLRGVINKNIVLTKEVK